MKASFTKTSLLGVLAFLVSVRAGAQVGAAAAAISSGGLATTTAAASTATAGALKNPCASGNMLTCTMMALAIGQIGASLFQKSGDGSSASGLSSGYGNTAGTAGVTNADPSGTYTTADGTTVLGDTAKTANALVANGLGSLADGYVADVKTLQASGVTVAPDGSSATLPNGTNVPSSALSSPQAMQNAGFSSSDISGAQAALASAAKTIAQSKVGSLTNDSGGGGGGSGLKGDGGGGGSGDGDLAGKLARANAAAKKGSGVSGLSKKFGNDNIGVAGDDIFEMITRRYQARDKVDTFLKK